MQIILHIVYFLIGYFHCTFKSSVDDKTLPCHTQKGLPCMYTCNGQVDSIYKNNLYNTSYMDKTLKGMHTYYTA